MSEDGLAEKERAIIGLARGLSTDAVGAELGVSGRTVRRWRDEPGFAASVEAARRETLAEAVAALGHAARQAVETLFEASLNAENEAVRVRAALGLIGALPSFAQHASIEDRLARVEAAVAAREP